MDKGCLKKVSEFVFICTISGAIVFASMVDSHDHLPHSEQQISLVRTNTFTSSTSIGTMGGTSTSTSTTL